jgi:two-component system CheB/CheR fusion protein
MASKRATPDARSRSAGVGQKFPIVCIGASAGGLDAFSHLLEHLTPTTGMAYVIIQHLDPTHPSVLPPLLAKKSPLPVAEAKHDVRVQRDRVYVIPPDTVMTLTKGALRLASRASQKKFMPIDSFMQSLAEEHGNLAIGVILSGTATDGTVGLEAIKAAGGITFAQDEKSAQYTGMPHSAAASGCIDFILPPADIARELVKLSRQPILAKAATTGVAGSVNQFEKVFQLLRKGTGLDFTSYKRTTIRRRIARRMTLHRFTAIENYIAFLQKTPAEVDALSQDLLIKVTTFFRDAEAFDALRKKIFPALLKHKKRDDTVRIWIPGCSTGEEVYSIGITLIETVAETAPGLHCQIFATDISEAAVDRARSGFYTDNIRQDISPERLKKYFTKTAEGYRIGKAVRDICIFARQDLTKDPPFSKLDLISCRNVLIYMGSDLQKRIIPIFHYALRPGGYLMLGSAESTGSFTNLFTLVEKKGKIYGKKQLEVEPRLDYSSLTPTRPTPPVERKGTKAEVPSSEVDLFKEADKITLTRFAPAGVLLNDEMEVIQFRGHTAPYLENAPGKPTVHVLELVREDLVFELKTTCDRALRQGVMTRSHPVEVRHNGHVRLVAIEVVPIKSSLSHKPFLLAVFSELSVTKVRSGKTGTVSSKEESRLLGQLRRELNAVREELQSVIEEQEAAQEEFKSANEEILSSNEELQSTNEELETAKEELQSANEELTTLNEELLTRNTELGQLNSDITNLLSSISVPILMLSQDLRIRRFTPVAGALLNLIPGDLGRPLTDINPNLDLPKLDQMVTEVIDSMMSKEREVRSKDGRWYSLRIRPYRTIDNKIDGATLMFLDIDALKRSQQAEAVVEVIREPVVVLDGKMRVKNANRAYYKFFNAVEHDVLNKPIYELGNGQWNVPALRTLLEEVLPKRTSVEDFKVEHTFPTIGRRTLLVNARRLKADHDDDELILVAMQDVTGHLADDGKG